jgi:hypothetical protein
MFGFVGWTDGCVSWPVQPNRVIWTNRVHFFCETTFRKEQRHSIGSTYVARRMRWPVPIANSGPAQSMNFYHFSCQFVQHDNSVWLLDFGARSRARNHQYLSWVRLEAIFVTSGVHSPMPLGQLVSVWPLI